MQAPTEFQSSVASSGLLPNTSEIYARKLRKKSTIASRVVDLISCMGCASVKGLNMRFYIRAPDSQRP